MQLIIDRSLLCGIIKSMSKEANVQLLGEEDPMDSWERVRERGRYAVQSELDAGEVALTDAVSQVHDGFKASRAAEATPVEVAN
jgi:hypothetical protein